MWGQDWTSCYKLLMTLTDVFYLLVFSIYVHSSLPFANEIIVLFLTFFIQFKIIGAYWPLSLSVEHDFQMTCAFKLNLISIWLFHQVHIFINCKLFRIFLRIWDGNDEKQFHIFSNIRDLSCIFEVKWLETLLIFCTHDCLWIQSYL